MTSNIEHPTSNISLDRYHRQMLLPGFGEQGQKKLLASKVMVVGCGALGTVAANLLARAGVGHLVIADRDFIELTNLQRQVLFDEEDVEQAIPKAEAARRKIARINSQVRVTAVVEDVNHTNIEKLAADCNVIVDGVDNFETRYLVNDVAVKLGIPYIYGGAVGTSGASFAILPHTHGEAASAAGTTPWEQAGKATPCLRCIFEQAPPPGLNPTCDTVGVLATIVSIIASHEVNEALKVLTGNWDVISPTMLNVDTWRNTTRQFKVTAAYDAGDCPCCKHRKFEVLDGKFGSSTTTLCGRNAVQLTHKIVNGRLNFDEIAERLRSHGTVKANKFMLRAEVTDNGKPYELTVFTDGRAIVKGTKEANVAKSIYAKYVGA
ncbi:MAG: ThiF family adenylyltransferase [Phycisphaeraceae bacterium]